MPYSRATTAPWELAPPISITSPPAVRNSGVQPGSVDGRDQDLARLEVRADRVEDHPGDAGDRARRGRRAGAARRPSRVGGGARLGLGAVGEQHARHVPAAQLWS